MSILSRLGHLKITPIESLSNENQQNKQNPELSNKNFNIFDESVNNYNNFKQLKPRLRKKIGYIGENIALECPVDRISETSNPPYYYHDANKPKTQKVCMENDHQSGIAWRQMKTDDRTDPFVEIADLDDENSNWEKITLKHYTNTANGLLELSNVESKQDVRKLVFACFDVQTRKILNRIKIRPKRSRRGLDLRLLAEPTDEYVTLNSDNQLMGPSTVMSCAVNINENVTVRWFKGGRQVLSTVNGERNLRERAGTGRFSLRGSASLEISNINQEDEGLYRVAFECVV